MGFFICLFISITCHFSMILLFIAKREESVGATNFYDSKVKSSYNFGKSFLGLDKCNVCIGTSACKKFLKEEIRFKNWLSPHLQLPSSDLQSYSGNYSDDLESWRPVDISRLSSKSQHDLADKRICSFFLKRKSCSIEGILKRTERFQKWMTAKRLTPDLVQGLPVLFLRCPSQRLLDRIIRRYAEVFDAGSVYMTHLTDKDKLRLLYTLSVNSFPIILQIFPGAEGWPFPKYLGSCGRLFVSTSTQPLTSFNNSDPDVAADLGYQLLQIIHYLSNNDFHYFFYFTYIDKDTFGTVSNGRLYIRDTRRMGIIDMEEGTPTNNRTNEHIDIFSCLSSECPPIFSSCANITDKQNLLLVCKDLLPFLLSGKFPHSTQQKIDIYISACSDDHLCDLEARNIINELLQILSSLRTCDAQFAYRYPDCKYYDRH